MRKVTEQVNGRSSGLSVFAKAGAQLNSVDEIQPGFARHGRGCFAARQRVVIADRQGRQPRGQSLFYQTRRRRGSVGSGCMCVEIDHGGCSARKELVYLKPRKHPAGAKG